MSFKDQITTAREEVSTISNTLREDKSKGVYLGESAAFIKEFTKKIKNAEDDAMKAIAKNPSAEKKFEKKFQEINAHFVKLQEVTARGKSELIKEVNAMEVGLRDLFKKFHEETVSLSVHVPVAQKVKQHEQNKSNELVSSAFAPQDLLSAPAFIQAMMKRNKLTPVQMQAAATYATLQGQWDQRKKVRDGYATSAEKLQIGDKKWDDLRKKVAQLDTQQEKLEGEMKQSSIELQKCLSELDRQWFDAVKKNPTVIQKLSTGRNDTFISPLTGISFTIKGAGTKDYDHGQAEWYKDPQKRRQILSFGATLIAGALSAAITKNPMTLSGLVTGAGVFMVGSKVTQATSAALLDAGKGNMLKSAKTELTGGAESVPALIKNLSGEFLHTMALFGVLGKVGNMVNEAFVVKALMNSDAKSLATIMRSAGKEKVPTSLQKEIDAFATSTLKGKAFQDKLRSLTKELQTTIGMKEVLASAAQSPTVQLLLKQYKNQQLVANLVAEYTGFVAFDTGTKILEEGRMVTLKEFLDISKDAAAMIAGLKLGNKMIQLTASTSFKALSKVHREHALQQARLIHEGMIKAIKYKSTQEFAKAVDMAKAFPKVMQNPDLVFVGATNLHPRAVESYGKKVIAESGFMTDKQRISATAKELGLKFLSKAQEKALLAAHYVKGKGLGKYTKEEIAEKKKILEKEFTKEQVQKILDKGLAGYSEWGRRSEFNDSNLEDFEEAGKNKEQDLIVVNEATKHLNEILNTEIKYSFAESYKDAIKGIDLTRGEEKVHDSQIINSMHMLQRMCMEPLNEFSIVDRKEVVKKIENLVERMVEDSSYLIEAKELIKQEKDKIEKYEHTKSYSERKKKEEEESDKLAPFYKKKWEEQNPDLVWLKKNEGNEMKDLWKDKSEKNISEGEGKSKIELQKINEELHQVIHSVEDKLVDRADYLENELSKDPFNKTIVEELIVLYKKFEYRSATYTSSLEKYAREQNKNMGEPTKRQAEIIKENSIHTKKLHEKILKFQKILTDLNSKQLKKDGMLSINVKNSEYSKIATELTTVQRKITHFTENPHLGSPEKLAVLRTEEALLKKKLSEIKQEIANIENNR